MILRCNHPGCGRRILKSERGRCSDHARQHKTTRQNKAKQYGRRWRKTRELFLQRYPLCLRCLALGHGLKPVAEVDHIERLDDDATYEQIHNFDNLAGLCKSCHTWKGEFVDGSLGAKRVPLSAYKKQVLKGKLTYETM